MRILHDRLCRASGLYRAWHAHPHNRHHHWLAASLACVLAAYAIAGAWGAAELEQDVFASQLLGISVARAQTVCNVPPPNGAINQVNDAIAACNGSVARLSSGATYTSGTVEITSGITLDLNNARLASGVNSADFKSFKCGTCSKVFVGTSRGARNVGLIGPGTLSRRFHGAGGRKNRKSTPPNSRP